MRVHEDGPEDGVPIVFCHGFPELAFSWRHQVKGLGARGYRTIAPDLRGYGETDRTQDVADYRLANLCQDMAGLLEVLGIGKAVFVGHDLGGLLVYAMGVGRPDLCHGVVSLNTPYRPRPRKNPIQLFCEGRGGGFYMVTFQKAPAEPGDPRAGIAENVLGRDVRRTFRALMVVPQQCYAHYQALYPEVMELLPIGIFVGEPLLGELPVLSEEDLTTYVRTYEATGFTGGLNWYRNLVRNWEDSETSEELEGAPELPPTRPIDVPVLMVTASRDPVIRPEMAAAMPLLVRKLTMRSLDCGHWTQQEKPEEVNALIDCWIRGELGLEPRADADDRAQR